MRRFDKKINLKKANILAEQRYLATKNLNEGPMTDVDGVTNNLLRHYIYGHENGKNLDAIDSQVYDLMKKTLSVHGATPEIKKEMYLTMAEKLKNSGIPKLYQFGQAYNMIARSFGADNEFDDTTKLINHIKSQGGLQE